MQERAADNSKSDLLTIGNLDITFLIILLVDFLVPTKYKKVRVNVPTAQQV